MYDMSRLFVATLILKPSFMNIGPYHSGKYQLLANICPKIR